MISEQEIRDAAERYRQHIAGLNAMVHPRELPYTYVDETTGAGGMVQEAWDRDAHRLAKAYLAEHPDDDAELVTEEWLLGVAEESCLGCWHNFHLNADQSRYLIVYVGDHLYAAFGNKSEEAVVLDPITTRNQVRQLLAALQMK